LARTKAVLGAGLRLSDHLSASMLARTYPSALINEILDEHECNSQRVRSLSAATGVYFCMALSLYPEAAYEHVFSVVAQGLSWMQGGKEEFSIAKSSVSAMRSKLGAAPLKTLMERSCIPLCDVARHPDGFYAGRRLVAIDGSNFEIPDEASNVGAFGRPGSRTGVAGYPQAQCAALVECASHAIFAANLEGYHTAEWDVCLPLLAHLTQGMLCLADRGFNGYEHWVAAHKTGADLLWRVASNRILPVFKTLTDGSYLSMIYPSTVSSKKQRNASDKGVLVRVIEYALPNTPESEPRYRLLTTLLDEVESPALELAAVFHERWEIESVFDELKIHLVKNRRVLRSKTAELVRQEFYGWVLMHYAVRSMMHEAASAHRIRQRSLSFTASVQIYRQAQPQSGAFSPSAPKKAHMVA
jgi:hypothetical protein